MAEKSDDKAQKSAQQKHAEAVQAALDEKEQRRIHAESGPVSVMERNEANPNPPDLANNAPRQKAQRESGMNSRTLQEDVGLRDAATGLQPKEAGEVENASAVSTHQHLGAPQGDALAEEDDGKGKKKK